MSKVDEVVCKKREDMSDLLGTVNEYVEGLLRGSSSHGGSTSGCEFEHILDGNTEIEAPTCLSENQELVVQVDVEWYVHYSTQYFAFFFISCNDDSMLHCNYCYLYQLCSDADVGVQRGGEIARVHQVTCSQYQIAW